MQLEGKVAVITGAAHGIGAALARRFAGEGAKGVVVADIEPEPLDALARDIGALPVRCDVTREADITHLIGEAERAYGAIDLFCSNAGILRLGDETTPDEDWQLNWNIHVMAHVYAARALVPKMTARGSGTLLITASAAGLLSHIDSASYAVTKHAAVAFAEWLAIAYGDQGLQVAVLCPQAVRTAMTAGREGDVAALDGMLEPEQVADCVVEALDRNDFLILPHPEVREYLRRKAADPDRWLAGMRRFQTALYPNGDLPGDALAPNL